MGLNLLDLCLLANLSWVPFHGSEFLFFFGFWLVWQKEIIYISYSFLNNY